ncbi:glycine-rich domain-containing protein, partial [Streptomyces sp. NPDC055025]
MSMAAHAPAKRDARSLLTAEEFAGVTSTVLRANPGMEQPLAERITLEALKFVATAAGRTSGHMAPSPVVDEGWHALIL